MEHSPITVSEALGLGSGTLPSPQDALAFMCEDLPTPPELMAGILHRGCKLLLGGASKSNKSWCLLELALAVATGKPWWGRATTRAHVLYVNFELPRWAVRRRLEALVVARPELKTFTSGLTVWNLRGATIDAMGLQPGLQTVMDSKDVGLVIIDPAYKLLGNRDENANGDITSLMNEFEQVAKVSGAAVVIAHHFAKGDSTTKDPIDRMSGAGAWARDPDCILILTAHEEPGCFTVHSILRNLPILPEFVIEWEYPLMKAAPGLDPTALRRRGGNKILTDRQFIEKVLSTTPRRFTEVVESARAAGVPRTTCARYLSRLTEVGSIKFGNGLYWIGTPEEQSNETNMKEPNETNG